jgi:iron-sulfur cluster repair protein YtfE (RIC family)
MLRDRNLVPLSHQHQRVLALCVRLDRAVHAGEVDLESWQAEIQQHFESEVSVHFAAEEKVIFPAAGQVQELKSIITELRAEHDSLRRLFSQAAQRELDLTRLTEFIEKLAQHIRKEERQLFEGMQAAMTPEQLTRLGTELNQALGEAHKSCALPLRRAPL